MIPFSTDPQPQFFTRKKENLFFMIEPTVLESRQERALLVSVDTGDFDAAASLQELHELSLIHIWFAIRGKFSIMYIYHTAKAAGRLELLERKDTRLWEKTKYG